MVGCLVFESSRSLCMDLEAGTLVTFMASGPARSILLSLGLRYVDKQIRGKGVYGEWPTWSSSWYGL